MWAGVAAVALLISPASAVPSGLEAILERVAAATSAKFNCSVSIAYRDAGGRVAAAAGIIDFDAGVPASVHDRYPFGSVTKFLTGASMLKLVAEGAVSLDSQVAPLVDPILAKMADADPSQGFRSMADLFGATNISNTTIRQLLSMTSGVPDFDTATPCFPGVPHCVPTDSLRAALYADPDDSYSPTRLMSVPWVAHHWRPCDNSIMPGLSPFCYSSTNFMLLGMVLAANAKATSWSTFDQAAMLPQYLRDSLQFANSGSPRNYTTVHGYDRTSYNVPQGQHNHHDNFAVNGVFSGWTASDIVATPQAIADLTWEVYGPNHAIAPEDAVRQMIPGVTSIYGLATFNLSASSGQSGKYGVAYGHLGATYGYQSVTAYFPALQIALTVATNIERDFQEQPSHAMCFAYNEAAALLLNRTARCSEVPSGGFYFGGCKCEPFDAEEVAGEAMLIV